MPASARRSAGYIDALGHFVRSRSVPTASANEDEFSLGEKWFRNAGEE
jgi:hypothetical protein